MGARSAFALVALVATTTHALSDEALAKFQAATAANKIAEPFDPPHEADEWYMVTIANVSVGYMHTTVTVNDEFVRTMEVMDVQVSRGLVLVAERRRVQVLTPEGVPHQVLTPPGCGSLHGLCAHGARVLVADAEARLLHELELSLRVYGQSEL